MSPKKLETTESESTRLEQLYNFLYININEQLIDSDISLIHSRTVGDDGEVESTKQRPSIKSGHHCMTRKLSVNS